VTSRNNIRLSYDWSAASSHGGWFGVPGNGVRHINEVKLRRARLVLRLVTIVDESTIPVFIQAHSAWPSLRGHVQRAPGMISAISEKKRRFCSYDIMALYKTVYKYK